MAPRSTQVIGVGTGPIDAQADQATLLWHDARTVTTADSGGSDSFRTVRWACVAASSSMFPGQAIWTVSTTGWRSTHLSSVMRKVGAARPAWWATSAVPYPYFWLLPSAGVVIGLAAASEFGVPVWLGFICAETPALALEAWWRHTHRPSGRTP